MLFDPARHLTLNAAPFDAEIVRATIGEVLKATRAGFDAAHRLWPVHAKDWYEGAPDFITCFYFGAAGVIWAANKLAEFAQFNLSDLPSIDEVLGEHLQRGDADKDAPFVGELGVRFVKQLIRPSEENFATLVKLMQSAASNPCREILYGGPGALAMAHVLWKKGDSRFRAVCSAIAKDLQDQRETDAKSSARIWSQKLGNHRKFIGAAHGTSGNFGVLLRVLRDLGEPTVELLADVEKFLNTYANVEGELCNWSRGADDNEYSALTVVHWCHGAPGILTDLASEVPVGASQILDQLFLKGANLVWIAGPLEKGTSLCHGTAGSGLALLKTFERTQDELWLDRAKAFAMHVCAQYVSEREKFGQVRFSLWTGDLGMAVFLRDVLRGHGCSPGISPN